MEKDSFNMYVLPSSSNNCGFQTLLQAGNPHLPPISYDISDVWLFSNIMEVNVTCQSTKKQFDKLSGNVTFQKSQPGHLQYEYPQTM